MLNYYGIEPEESSVTNVANGEEDGGGGGGGEEGTDDKDVKYRVCMLGQTAAGKTALVSQFLTSEYMNTYDASLGEFRVILYEYSDE